MKMQEKIKDLIERIKKVDCEAFNLYTLEPYDFDYDCKEYLYEELNWRVNELSDKYPNSVILKRFEKGFEGGTSSIREEEFNRLINVKGTNYYILEDTLEEYFNENDLELDEDLDEVELSKDAIEELKDEFFVKNENSNWENILIYDENRVILNEEKLTEEIRKERSWGNPDYWSKDEIICMLENPKDYDIEYVEEIIEKIETILEKDK
jgi:hypothetical protein